MLLRHPPALINSNFSSQSSQKARRCNAVYITMPKMYLLTSVICYLKWQYVFPLPCTSVTAFRLFESAVIRLWVPY